MSSSPARIAVIVALAAIALSSNSCSDAPKSAPPAAAGHGLHAVWLAPPDAEPADDAEHHVVRDVHELETLLGRLLDR